MPWVGYEYLRPEGPKSGFLPFAVQTELVTQAFAIFNKLFDGPATSACAPGYRANADTYRAWAQCGIRVAQIHSAKNVPPYMDDFEVLSLSRTIDFEPAHGEANVAESVRRAEKCFSLGIPAIVSVHSVNFHSSLKDFRGPTLRALDELLSALETRHPNLLYVHDQDLYQLITQGKFENAGPSQVKVKHMEKVPIHRAVLEN